MTAAAPDDPVTTVKVPRSLRTRIARDAAASGQTAAGFLATVVDQWEREQRLAGVRRAYERRDKTPDAKTPDAKTFDDKTYDDETRAWDAADSDGLDD